MKRDPVFKDGRKATYLNPEGAEKPLKSPVPPEVLDRARCYRLQRLRDRCAAADCAALLLYDSTNIRYAFDCSNMQVWRKSQVRFFRLGHYLTEGRIPPMKEA